MARAQYAFRYRITHPSQPDPTDVHRTISSIQSWSVFAMSKARVSHALVLGEAKLSRCICAIDQLSHDSYRSSRIAECGHALHLVLYPYARILLGQKRTGIERPLKRGAGLDPG